MGARSERKRPASGRTGRAVPQRPVHLIYTNGKVTESSYLEWLKGELSGCALQIKKISGKDPFTLAKNAIEDIASYERTKGKIPAEYAGVWVVTDVDLFKGLSKVEVMLAREGLTLVLSNPCFAVWLIDHTKQCPGSCCTTKACEAEAVKCGVVRSRSHKDSVSKAKEPVREALKGRLADAVSNAKRHNTNEKASARGSNPDDVENYRVWTDMPTMIGELTR